MVKPWFNFMFYSHYSSGEEDECKSIFKVFFVLDRSFGDFPLSECLQVQVRRERTVILNCTSFVKRYGHVKQYLLEQAAFGLLCVCRGTKELR